MVHKTLTIVLHLYYCIQTVILYLRFRQCFLLFIINNLFSQWIYSSVHYVIKGIVFYCYFQMFLSIQPFQKKILKDVNIFVYFEKKNRCFFLECSVLFRIFIVSFWSNLKMGITFFYRFYQCDVYKVRTHDTSFRLRNWLFSAFKSNISQNFLYGIVIQIT